MSFFIPPDIFSPFTYFLNDSDITSPKTYTLIVPPFTLQYATTLIAIVFFNVSISPVEFLIVSICLSLSFT